ncbi:hypothetical protein LUX12_04735 [Streptomyces somaliensis]|uniref:hypothetical protein n=1 Tax=Streptomyces somaliensis TaxID=78355 RepID=UPI0020CC4758|nr:hypothetical protein [Streptomyces somaliensis]MCP9944250.1 hypothetical protein [Streptomyces somaliensis]MCP9962515.1 hypothetical protein [Streptomyces somaliensis]MCP9975341.1 hypothetical protein [Streptomyces somaliensis]
MPEERFTVPVTETNDFGVLPDQAKSRKSNFSVRRPYRTQQPPDALVEAEHEGRPAPRPASGRSTDPEEP